MTGRLRASIVAAAFALAALAYVVGSGPAVAQYGTDGPPYWMARACKSTAVVTFGDTSPTIAATTGFEETSAALTAPRTATLPAASVYPSNCPLTVFDEAGGVSGTDTLTVQRAGSDTINGGTSVVIASAYGGVTFASNGSNAWTIVSDELIQAFTCGSNQFVNQLSASGVFTCGTPTVGTTPLNTGSGTASLTGPAETYVCTAACTITPPVPSAGYTFTVLNDDNVSSVITLGAIGSGAMYENTARTAYGTAGTGSIASSGATGDSITIVARDATHYLTFLHNGTWALSAAYQGPGDIASGWLAFWSAGEAYSAAYATAGGAAFDWSCTNGSAYTGTVHFAASGAPATADVATMNGDCASATISITKAYDGSGNGNYGTPVGSGVILSQTCGGSGNQLCFDYGGSGAFVSNASFTQSLPLSYSAVIYAPGALGGCPLAQQTSSGEPYYCSGPSPNHMRMGNGTFFDNNISLSTLYVTQEIWAASGNSSFDLDGTLTSGSAGTTTGLTATECIGGANSSCTNSGAYWNSGGEILAAGIFPGAFTLTAGTGQACEVSKNEGTWWNISVSC